jgi:hypothetical protein
VQFGNLGTIERKVLGAMIILARDDKTITTSMNKLAEIMGYKKSGGALTLAISILERDNFLVKLDKGKFKLLI